MRLPAAGSARKRKFDLPFALPDAGQSKREFRSKIGEMEHVVAKFRSFREAEEATREYYRRLSSAERLEILFQLRARACKEDDAASGRLARVYRISRLERG
jgi:hypothetical protein